MNIKNIFSKRLKKLTGKQFFIRRVVENPDGIFGVLIDDDIPFAVTLEPSSDEEHPAIPAGQYKARRITSPNFGNTFQITDVKDRTHILLHKGNTEEDTLGCVLVGEQFEPLNGKTAVLQSGKAFKEFLTRTKGLNSFTLVIEDRY